MQAFANYQRLADKFGGNPTSRAKIKRVKPQQVMDKYGITLNLLAEIQAECHIEIARRKAL